MERLLTPREVADYMSVAPRTIKEWLRRGELAGIKVKNMWRIRESEVRAFLKRGNPAFPVKREENIGDWQQGGPHE